MNYNEFVTQPIAVWRRILHKRDEVAKLEEICLIANSQLGERVQSSIENRKEKSLVAYAQSKNELNEMIDELMVVQAEVREFFYECLEIDEADVLEWKYVNGKSIKDIADILGVEEQTARNKVCQYDKKARKLYIEYKKV